MDATRDEKISYIDRLPNEILEKILTETLLSSAFSWPSHVCRTYNDLKNVSVRFCQITSRLAWTLPSIHLANRGEAGIVCVKTLSCKFRPPSGLIIEVKRILASRDWKRASLKLRFRGLGCNLGQNKMRNKTTPPPESMMNSRSNQSAPFFPSLKWGEGWS